MVLKIKQSLLTMHKTRSINQNQVWILISMWVCLHVPLGFVGKWNSLISFCQCKFFIPCIYIGLKCDQSGQVIKDVTCFNGFKV